MALDLKYGTLEIPGIEDDEPVFIIRGRDPLALDALTEYMFLADDAGCHDGVGDGVQGVKNLFAAWQRENETRLPA